MRYLIGTACLGLLVLVAVSVRSVRAGDLPKETVWVAHGETSSGYAQSVAIGAMLKRRYGTDLHVIPGKDDLARLTSLRDEEADYCACSVSSYFSQEGVFLFANPDWGPQPVRMLMSNFGSAGLSLATAADAGIKTLADLRGKRVAWITDAPAVNWSTSAYLAFAGLSWRDVVKVELPGLRAFFEAMIDGEVDAGFSSTVAPRLHEIAASPRGLFWPPLPHDDQTGWARMLASAPIYSKVRATEGPAIDKANPPELSHYPYPILITKAEQGADEVYEMVKAMVTHFTDYKDAARGAAGWTLGAQRMQWAIPYHDGAIRYWKEAGLWSAEAQAHNDRLIARQGAIKMAWVALQDKESLDREDWIAAWTEARAKALRKAGFDPVFK